MHSSTYLCFCFLLVIKPLALLLFGTHEHLMTAAVKILSLKRFFPEHFISSGSPINDYSFGGFKAVVSLTYSNAT